MTRAYSKAESLDFTTRKQKEERERERGGGRERSHETLGFYSSCPENSLNDSKISHWTLNPQELPTSKEHQVGTDNTNFSILGLDEIFYI